MQINEDNNVSLDKWSVVFITKRGKIDQRIEIK